MRGLAKSVPVFQGNNRGDPLGGSPETPNITAFASRISWNPVINFFHLAIATSNGHFLSVIQGLDIMGFINSLIHSNIPFTHTPPFLSY